MYLELESIPVLLEEDVDASNIMLRLYGQSVRKSGWWARSPFSADNGNLAIICLKILDAADFVLVWTDQVNESDSAEYQNHYKQREYFQAHLRNSGLTTHTVKYFCQCECVCERACVRVQTSTCEGTV